MTLDLGDVGQTTDRESVKLPVQGPRDRFPNTRLSHTGRSDHADNLSLDGTPEFTDGEELEDPVLDVL